MALTALCKTVICCNKSRSFQIFDPRKPLEMAWPAPMNCNAVKLKKNHDKERAGG